MRPRVGSVLAFLIFLVAHDAAAQPSNTSRLSWVTNGTVRAATVHEQTLYIGGTFTRVAPAANFLGPWFGISRTTGAALPRLPLADGAVLAIETDGAGGFFVGGRFTHIGGVARASLAHVLADGTVDPWFAPLLQPAFRTPITPDELDVRSLARVGDVLYVGGSFKVSRDATVKEGFAALEVATGALRQGMPTLSPLRADKIVLEGQRVFAVGSRVSMTGPVPPAVIAADAATGTTLWIRDLTGEPRDAVLAAGRLIVAGRFEIFNAGLESLISLDPASGVIDTTWAPIRPTIPRNAPLLHAVTVVGSTVYVGGSFTQVGGVRRTNLAAVDLATGTLTPWAPSVAGTVWDLVPASAVSVYASGAFQHVAGATREGLAEIDAAGAVTPWSPDAYSTEVRTLHATAGSLLAGGLSAVAGGVARDNLAAFALDQDEVLPWAPMAPYTVNELATDGQRVFVDFRRVTDGGVTVPAVPVVALDAVNGSPAPWSAPAGTNELLGLIDGQIYVAADPYFVRRIDAMTGVPDPSFRFAGDPARLFAAHGVLYFGGRPFGFNGKIRPGLAAVDSRTGALSPWDPNVLPTQTNHRVTAVAIMGQTMYVAHEELFNFSQGMTAVDTDSAVSLPFPASFPGRVQDLVAADALVLAVGVPTIAGTAAVAAYQPDGTAVPWNPELTSLDFEPRQTSGQIRRATQRLIATPTDIVVTGVQSLGPIPVHGIAVFSRQPPQAPASLDAVVLDNRVRLSWETPVPAAFSYVIEVGSRAGASDILVEDTGSVPLLDAVAPAGTYFVRVRSAGAPPGAASVATNEIAVRAGCVAPRLPPTRLGATLAGTTVTLTWTAPAFIPVTHYVIEAGSAPGQANLARLSVSAAETSFTTQAPLGTYFVRVRGENACGFTPATADLWITVGGDPLPSAPVGLTVRDLTPELPYGLPHTYLVEWSPVTGATSYVLEVGSEPGLANLVTSATTSTTIGPAQAAFSVTHFLRVRAVGAAGVGPPSAEYVLIAR